MAQPLVPCPSCARHVLATETRCPFCASALPDDLEDRVIPGAPRRMSRAAAFMLGASLAVTGCDGTVTTGEASGASSGGGGSGQGGASSGGQDGGPVDDGGGQALYGVPPPVDAGADAPEDDGGVMAMYGVPPPQDGGAPQDDGGAQPLYGAVPPPQDT